MDKVTIVFTHECDKCGARLETNMVEINNIINVELCPVCTNEYKEAIKEKAYGVLDRIEVMTETIKDDI